MNTPAAIEDPNTAVTDFPLAAQLTRDPFPVAYELEAFRSTTGLSFFVTLPHRRYSLGTCGSIFCRCLAGAGPTCRACVDARQSVDVADADAPARPTACFANVAAIAAPVSHRGTRIATLWTSSFLVRPPETQRFERSLDRIRRQLSPAQQHEARIAYFRLPVVDDEQQRTVAGLLSAIASVIAWRLTAIEQTLTDATQSPVARAKEFVAAHLHEPLSLHAVAQQAHLSRYHFCRVFKTSTGYTLRDYVAQRRILTATTLLESPGARVAEVGFAVGFTSASHFNRVFRKYMGLSPGEYREHRQAVRLNEVARAGRGPQPSANLTVP